MRAPLRLALSSLSLEMSMPRLSAGVGLLLGAVTLVAGVRICPVNQMFQNLSVT